MSAKSWLEALKATIEEEPRSPREESRKPIPPTAEKVRKPRDGAGGKVVDTKTTRPIFSPRDEEERRLKHIQAIVPQIERHCCERE